MSRGKMKKVEDEGSRYASVKIDGLQGQLVVRVSLLA